MIRTWMAVACCWTLSCISSGVAETGNPCGDRQTCDQCIAAHPDCAWCVEPKEGVQRCQPRRALESVCPDFVSPRNRAETLEDRELNGGGADQRDAVQVRPQEVLLYLRPGDPFDLQIRYREAENYPLDLYYLMDLSYSMKDDKDKLADLGDKLATQMKNITGRFRLGFGAFVEKVALPYVNTYPQRELDYEEPYGFRNYLPLSNDAHLFQKKVKESRVSGNYDAPEAGLDALAQAVVCQAIGWRNDSRKLVVLSTDAGYHLAGDGKLAGIVQPFDGDCHLDSTDSYSASLTYDYPSVGQIRNLLRERKIGVIFAVTHEQTDVYRNLMTVLDESTVGTLDSDSSNVVDLIRDQYQKIRSSVKLRDTAAWPLSVVYKSFCDGNKWTAGASCDNVSVNGEVKFVARIQLAACPDGAGDGTLEFGIFPTHLREEIRVRVRTVCQCDCRSTDPLEGNRTVCSDRGARKCGLCVCDSGHRGQECECDAGVDLYGQENCFGDNDTVVCSGRGKCSCGQCECFAGEDGQRRFGGKYCQCDDLSCDWHRGLLCGGPERGKCECGRCVCLPGWKGPVCQCPDSEAGCLDPDTQKICNDRGKCSCGECKCRDSETERYDGHFCQRCLICPGSCRAYRSCVQCKVFDSGPLDSEQCSNCSGIYLRAEDGEEQPEGSRECAFDDDDGCRFFFYYRLSDDTPLVTVRRRKECPKGVNGLVIGLGVTGGIVALGLLALLIWKLLTSLHDSREYAKFLKEINEKKWNQGSNPLYKEATSTFRNPAFGDGD